MVRKMENVMGTGPVYGSTGIIIQGPTEELI